MVKYHEPDAGDPGDWTWGVRWGGKFKELTYSLNYLYTWSQIPNDWTKDPYGLLVEREPNRMTVIGGSFDYMFPRLLGLENLVVRGEAAYFQHCIFVDENFINHKKQRFDYMLGFDKYFFIDYWVSIQFKQSWILDSPKWDNPYLTVSARLKGLYPDGYGGTYPVSEGFRDTQETQISFYVMKSFLPGKTLGTEFFALWGDEGEWWFRPKVKYEVAQGLYTSLGFNIYLGHRDDPLGEFHNNSNVFFEIKRDF